jgi:hypothetical protein
MFHDDDDEDDVSWMMFRDEDDEDVSCGSGPCACM